jgi:outer membrane protein
MAGRCFIILSVFVSILLGKTAAGAEEWDLNRCLELGLKQNPKIIAAEKAADAAKARVVQVRADYYPDLSLETDYSRYNGTFTSSSTSTPVSDKNSQTLFFLGLTQNIYDFGRREYKVQAAQEDHKAFGWDLKDTRLGVIDEIRQSYYAVLLADRGEKVREKELERTQLFLRQAKGFYQVGLKPRIDVTQAELQLILAQKALLKAKNDFSVSRVNLKKSLGLDYSSSFTLKDDLEADQVQWNLEDLRREAFVAQPTLNRLRTLVQFWEAQVKTAERDFWPRLAGTAKWGRSSTEIPTIDYTESWNVGVQLTVPIFSGFESRAKLDEFRAALGQAKANARNQELLILSALESGYLNLILAGKQIEVAREALRTARENLDLAEGRYQAGVGTMLEVTDARVSWIQSENDTIQSFYDYRIARYGLEKTLGRDF